MINLKRAYEEAEAGDGARYLVDRLWPRGKTKAALKIDGWLKDVAPSDALRRWFNHDPQRWNEFQKRYFAELDSKPDTWVPLVDAARKGSITLVYSAHDAEHNNGVALTEYLRARIAKRPQALELRRVSGNVTIRSLERIILVAHVAVVDYFRCRGSDAVCQICFCVYEARAAMVSNG